MPVKNETEDEWKAFEKEIGATEEVRASSLWFQCRNFCSSFHRQGHTDAHTHTHTHLCVAGVQNRSLLQSLTKMLNRQPSTACSMKSKSNSEFDTVESSTIQYVCSSASLQCTRSLHFPLCFCLCLSLSVSLPHPRSLACTDNL